MESFKANFIIFVLIVVFGFLGYWAVTGLKDATESMVADTKEEVEDVAPVVVSTPEESTPIVEEPKEEKPAVTTETPKDSDQPLIDELNKLIKDNVLMKKGSKGTRVGTVQKFLVRYGISMSVDNDYGDTTVNAVKKFQSEQGLSSDGQAGAGTYEEMVDWLTSN